MKKMWNIELYVAEETVIAEGQKIANRSGSPSAGAPGLVILIGGWWLARHMIRRLRWIVTRGSKRTRNYATR